MRGSGSVHVVNIKKYVGIISILQEHNPLIMSPYTKLRLLPLSAQAQYSKYLEMLPVLDNEAEALGVQEDFPH